MSDSEKDIKEELDKITTVNFSITKCPVKVFRKFIEFCKEETNDNYAFGIKLLLEAREANIKEVMLYEQYMVLKEEIEKIKEQVNKQEKPNMNGVKIPKTMGSKGEKNE